MKLRLVILFVCYQLQAFSQVNDTAILQNYLRQNMEVINVEKQNDIQLFDKDFYSNSLFLFGENHGSANPQLVDVLLFKQLYEKVGVKYYVAEVDDTKAWMLNNYMKDGNELWLTKVFSSWLSDTAQWANKSNYNKFKALQQFYKSLPANKKFTIIGIDLIQDYSLLKEHVNYFTKSKPAKISQPYLDSLINITDTITIQYKKSLGNFARRFLPELQKNKIIYQNIFKANFKAFTHFITSLSFTSAKMYRDSIMYRNMQSVLSIYNLQQQKFYGFLGFYHCLQTSYENSMPFAAQMQNYNTTMSSKIASIQMLTLQCKTLLPYTAEFKKIMPQTYADKLRRENEDFTISKKYVPFTLSNDDNTMKIDGMNYLKAITQKNTVTLFKLNAINSPFANNKLLAEVGGFQTIRFTNKNANTLQAFQYVLLFRDSKAGIPIE